MAELVVRFDVRFGERWCRGLMAAAMFFTVVPELASESVTLTTYYPAPSGVYAQLITTGNTYLARDGNSVIIGQTSNAGLLTIDATSSGSGGANVIQINGGGAPSATQLVIGGEYIRQAGPFNGALYIDASGSGNLALESVNSGNVTVGPTGAPNVTLMGSAVNQSVILGDLNIGGGAAGHNSYVQLVNPNPNWCQYYNEYEGGLGTGGALPSCTVGHYATYQVGVLAQGWTWQNRGGQVVAQQTPGVFTSQVYGLNTNTGVQGWMTLTQENANTGYWCCSL